MLKKKTVEPKVWLKVTGKNKKYTKQGVEAIKGLIKAFEKLGIK